MEKIIIASGPVIVEHNKVLLNQHGENTFWKFCGGRIDHVNATLAEWAKIKVKDEMGIDIAIDDDIPFISFTRKKTPNDLIDVLLVHFLASRINDKINPRDDIRQWAWLDLNHLPDNLGPNVLPALSYFKFIP